MFDQSLCGEGHLGLLCTDKLVMIIFFHFLDQILFDAFENKTIDVRLQYVNITLEKFLSLTFLFHDFLVQIIDAFLDRQKIRLRVWTNHIFALSFV
jgi:hypothetical protein